MSKVIKQQNWTDAKLEDEGFKRFARKKEIVLARRLPDEEAPKEIHTSWGDLLVAGQGYMICYTAEYDAKPNIDDYDHWPVEPNIFNETYAQWDEDWQPTPAEEHLMENGCFPYYKVAGVWAKEVNEEGVYMQSLEHTEPIPVEKGRMMAIGAKGEPYAMGKQTFHNRYDMEKVPLPDKNTDVADERGTILKKLIGFFKR